MELILKVDFWFDGMDELTEVEIKEALEAFLESGEESTNARCELLYVQTEDSGTI